MEAPIETRVHFRDHIHFWPNFSPYQMMDLGIHEGVILRLTNFNPSLRGKILTKVPKLLDTMDGPRVENNAYKVLAIDPPINLKLYGKHVSQEAWFEWYLKFYEGERSKLQSGIDNSMIKHWATVVDWAFNQAPKNHSTDQLLLQFGMNPGWETKIDLTKYAGY